MADDTSDTHSYSHLDSPVRQRLDRLESEIGTLEKLVVLEQRLAKLGSADQTQPSGLGGAIVLAVGLALLGGFFGLLAGMSENTGISSALLTGMISFVGGALVSFLGLRSQREMAEKPRLEPVHAGLGIGGFASGLIVSLLLGSWLRLVGVPPPPAALSSYSAASSSPDAGAQAGRVLLNLRGEEAQSREGAFLARIDSLLQAGHKDDAGIKCSQYWSEQSALAQLCAETYGALGDADAQRRFTEFGTQCKPPESTAFRAR